MDIELGELWGAVRELEARCTELEQRVSEVEFEHEPILGTYGPDDIWPPEDSDEDFDPGDDVYSEYTPGDYEEDEEEHDGRSLQDKIDSLNSACDEYDTLVKKQERAKEVGDANS